MKYNYGFIHGLLQGKEKKIYLNRNTNLFKFFGSDGIGRK